MRFLIALLIICSLSLPMAQAETRSQKTCLDSSRVRNWIVVNDETLLLDAGPKKYRVTLRNTCFNLGISPTLQFKGDLSGRICGSSLDAIRVQREQCRISSIEEIDKQTFKDAQSKKKLTLKVKKSNSDPEQSIAD